MGYSLWGCKESDTTKRLTHTHTDVKNELTVTKKEEWGEGIVREFGMDMYTLLYLKWVTNKVLLYSTGKSAQCYVAA